MAAEGPADVETVELLLEYGAEINERQWKGKTALHHISRPSIPGFSKLSLLLRNGADLDILDDEGQTPLEVIYRHFADKVILIKEFARLKIEGQIICRENWEFIHGNRELEKSFKVCLSQLKKMKSYKIQNNFSMYDLYSRKKMKTLVTLMKNKNFIDKFETLKNQFKHYGDDLDFTFKIAASRRNFLQCEEEKLYSVLKDYLPDLVINHIAFFICEEKIFYKYQLTRELL